MKKTDAAKSVSRARYACEAVTNGLRNRIVPAEIDFSTGKRIDHPINDDERDRRIEHVLGWCDEMLVRARDARIEVTRWAEDDFERRGRPIPDWLRDRLVAAEIGQRLDRRR